MDESKVTYHQQVSFCGKSTCKRCRDGIGHGPYWYAYKTINGRTRRTYIGKNLPAEAGQQQGLPERQQTLHEEKNTADLVRLRFYTLGQLRVERRKGTSWEIVHEAAFFHQHTRMLLSALLSSPTHSLTREQIRDALWPDLDFKSAMHALDRTVHSLRLLLDPSLQRVADTPLLLTERTIVALGSSPLVWIDADVFESHYKLVHSDTDEQDSHLEEALTLYAGPLLPHEPDLPWLLSRRQQLRRWVNELLEIAVNVRIRREQIHAAIHFLKRLLASDPAHEHAVQTMMQLLVQVHQPEAAVNVYLSLVDILNKQYAISPLPQTQEMYRELQRATGAFPVVEAGVSTDKAKAFVANDEAFFVGRERELRVFAELLTEIERNAKFTPADQQKSAAHLFGMQSSPQTLVLVGEVGVGKTHLGSEMRKVATQCHWDTVCTHSRPGDDLMMYCMWMPILRRLLAEQEILQEIQEHTELYAPLAALVPGFPAYTSPDSATLTPLVTEREHLALCDALCSLLLVASRRRPQFLFLEDMHYADRRSCELFARLARTIQGCSIILVATVLERECTDALRIRRAALQRERVVQELLLERFSDQQIELIVTSKYSPMQEQDLKKILECADGNPLFAQALAQYVQQGEIRVLPDVISAVFEQQMRHVSVACRRLLSRVAVLENPFSFPLARRIEPTQDEEHILELIEEALQEHLLLEEGRGKDVTYHFWHPLLAPYLATTISAARRAWLERVLH